MFHGKSYVDVNSVSFNDAMGLTFFSLHFRSAGSVVLTCLFCYLLGSKDGSVVRPQVSHLCDPGSNPGVNAVRGLSLLLVLFFDPEDFSPGTPVFPCPRNQHFQIPIRPGTLCAWANKLKFLELKPDYLPHGVLQICSLGIA